MREDLDIGAGTRDVRLADGRVVTLTQLDLGWIFGASVYNVKDSRWWNPSDPQTSIQTAVDTAPNGSVIWFPGGTYTLSGATAGIVLTGRTDLTFRGPGKIVLNQPQASSKHAFTVTSCHNLRFEGLEIDTKGADPFGAAFYVNKSDHIYIERNELYDSAPTGAYTGDHYAILITSEPTNNSSHVYIRENIITDIDIELAGNVNNIHITDNTILWTQTTAYEPTGSIGYYALGAGGFSCENIWIERNYIRGSTGGVAAILIDLDTPTSSNNTFRRIFIRANVILATGAQVKEARAIHIGTTSTGSSSSGNVFADILVTHNICDYDGSASPITPAVILFNTGNLSAHFHDRCLIAHNEIYANSRANIGIQANGLRYSQVHGNLIRNTVEYGIITNFSCSDMGVTDNRVSGSQSIAALSINSPNGNTVCRDNSITGTPTARITTSSLTSSDVVEDEPAYGLATLDFDLTAVTFQDATITVGGAAVGNPLELGIPAAAMHNDVHYQAWVSATGTVTVRAIRRDPATAVNPASGVFRAKVSRVIAP